MWLLFALLNPVSEALRSMFVKKTSAKIHPIHISLMNNFLSFVLFTPLLFFIDLKFNWLFWIGVTGSAIINLLASIYYIKAIASDDISIVMPMLSFTPLFLLFSSPFILGEFPGVEGLLGILCIVFGSYTLNLNIRKFSLTEPFKALLRSKGTRYMLFVSFIWSISANCDKISINNSSVIQHIAFVNIMVFLGMLLIVKLRGQLDLKVLNENKGQLMIISAFTASAFIIHNTALSLTLAAYVIALKRLAGMISVFLGHFFLKEVGIKYRLAGAAIMLCGVILILFD